MAWASGYRVGLRIRQSWVRLPSPTILFFCARYFLIYNIYDIFFHLNVSGARRDSECHFGSGDAQTQPTNDEAELQEQPGQVI